MKISAGDVWPVILDFIETHVGQDELEAFKEHFSVNLDHKKDPLVKAGGLQAMLQSFFKSNKKAYKQFVKKNAEKNSSDEDEVVEKKTKKREQKKADKKAKKSKESAELAGKKRKRTESMNSAKSNGSSGPVTRRKSQDMLAEQANAAKKEDAKDYHFKRIDASKFVDKISSQFADNSFEAKARFGMQGGDSYGSWSNSKLYDKKGASFIKEKNKMKNR